MSTRIPVLVAAVLAVAIAGLGWLLGISPLLAEASASREQRALVDAQNDAHAVRLVELRERFERLDELQAELDRMRVSLPGDADLADLLVELSDAAAATGTQLLTIGASDPLPYTADASSPASAASGTLYSIQVTVDVAGELAGVAGFADAVQAGPRLFVSNSFTAAAGRGTIVGHVFVLFDEPPAGAVPTP